MYISDKLQKVQLEANFCANLFQSNVVRLNYVVSSSSLKFAGFFWKKWGEIDCQCSAASPPVGVGIKVRTCYHYLSPIIVIGGVKCPLSYQPETAPYYYCDDSSFLNEIQKVSCNCPASEYFSFYLIIDEMRCQLSLMFNLCWSTIFYVLFVFQNWSILNITSID